jgi:hypothetical protein
MTKAEQARLTAWRLRMLARGMFRTIAAGQIAGIRGATSSDVGRREALLCACRFHECPIDPMMMMITLAEVENNLGPPSAS